MDEEISSGEWDSAELQFQHAEGFSDSSWEDEDTNYEGIDWEDVPLSSPNLTVTLGETRAQPSNKRYISNNNQKVSYALHLAEIPFMLLELKKRHSFTSDIRLQRRLKRYLPKLIISKSKKLKPNTGPTEIRTFLLGMVSWFKESFQCNSNGFRQNFTRLSYLLRYCDGSNSEFSGVLKNWSKFYGRQPPVLTVEDVRSMARNKMASRDYLVLFFYVLLKTIFPQYELRLCFALPLHTFGFFSKDPGRQISNGIGLVPNRYDTDLLSPYFWIEMKVLPNDLWIIDPCVNFDKDKIVCKVQMNEPVSFLEPTSELNPDNKQKFHYVVAISDSGKMMDVTPRYLAGVSYRYQNPPALVILRSYFFNAFLCFRRWLRILSPGYELEIEYKILQDLALKNFKLPQTRTGCKNDLNFIVPSLVKFNEVISENASVLGFLRGEPIHWRKDVVKVRSRQRWATIGRSVVLGSKPLKQKRYRTLKMRRLFSPGVEIKELYSFEQTTRTPSLPHSYEDGGKEILIEDVDFFRNDNGNVELYDFSQVPLGFKVLKNSRSVRNIVKQYNYEHRNFEILKTLPIVSGFDFRSSPGYALPIQDHILVNNHDHGKIQRLLKNEIDVTMIKNWRLLLKKISILHRIGSENSDDTVYN